MKFYSKFNLYKNIFHKFLKIFNKTVNYFMHQIQIDIR